MKRKKVWRAALLALVSATTLAACGKEGDPGESSDPVMLEEQPLGGMGDGAEKTDTSPQSPQASTGASGAQNPSNGQADLPGSGKEIPAYAQPYMEKIRELESSTEEGMTKREYDLIDIDGDDVPELVADVPGYFVSVFTFHDGTLYTAMDEWGYGVMGNGGYEYLPGENVVRNYNSDMAGAVMYVYYGRINDSYEMEDYYGESLSTWAFKDLNGNGTMEEGEYNDTDLYYYYGEKEISQTEYDSYLKPGDYRWIGGKMNGEAMIAQLSGEDVWPVDGDTLYGTWEITEVIFHSAVYAGGDEEDYVGFLLTYDGESCTLGEKSYEIRGCDFSLDPPGELKESFGITEGEKWDSYWKGQNYVMHGNVLSDDYFFGMNVYLVDEDNLLLFWDGVFFAAVRTEA